MATEISHTPRVPSIPTTLAEAHARICQLERENSRLRSTLNGMQHQISELEPGKYILLDNGDFCGPFSGDLSKMVHDYTSEGDPCTLIQVMTRHEGQTQPEDFSLTAGVDYPMTLSPAACW